MSGKLKSFFNSAVGEGDELKAFLSTNNGGLLTSTTSGGKESLDVNIASSDIAISVAESDVYAEDSAHVSGADGSFMLAVRRDTASSGVSADGDYASLNVDASGQLWVKDAAVLAQLISGVTVSATNLDIRDLVFASDKVDVSGSAVTVSATNLDVRDLVFATDKVDVSGSSVSISGTVGVTQSTSPWVVSASDLDIRDLAAATDSVSAWTKDGSGNSIASLGGALRVTDHADTITQAAPVIANTATAIAAAATQSRIMVQNLDSKIIYVGDSSVTAGTGYPVDKNEFIELPFSGTLYAITASGSTAAGNVRVLKLSA